MDSEMADKAKRYVVSGHRQFYRKISACGQKEVLRNCL